MGNQQKKKNKTTDRDSSRSHRSAVAVHLKYRILYC